MNNLLKLRIERHLKQKDLGEVIGTSGSNYGKFERGEKYLDEYQIIKIADFYNITTDELLNFKIDKIDKRITDKQLNELKKIISDIEQQKNNWYIFDTNF